MLNKIAQTNAPKEPQAKVETISCRYSEGKAFVEINLPGQNLIKLTLRSLSVKEMAFGMDEFVRVENRKQTLRVGQMLLSLLPKSLEKIEPENTDILSLRLGMGGTMKLQEILMNINDLEETKNQEAKE